MEEIISSEEIVFEEKVFTFEDKDATYKVTLISEDTYTLEATSKETETVISITDKYVLVGSTLILYGQEDVLGKFEILSDGTLKEIYEENEENEETPIVSEETSIDIEEIIGDVKEDLETEGKIDEETIRTIITAIVYFFSSFSGIGVILLLFRKAFKKFIQKQNADLKKEIEEQKQINKQLREQYNSATGELKVALDENNNKNRAFEKVIDSVEKLVERNDLLEKAFIYMVTTDSKLVKGNRAKEIVKILGKEETKNDEQKD